jgi:hypothetical protein
MDVGFRLFGSSDGNQKKDTFYAAFVSSEYGNFSELTMRHRVANIRASIKRARCECDAPPTELATKRVTVGQTQVCTRIRPLRRQKMINQNIEKTRRSLARKLHPDVFSTSTPMRSLIGYMVGEQWTYPYILSLACAPDGSMFAWENECDGYRRLICKRNDLVQAILLLACITDLTPAERTLLLSEVPPLGKRRA